MDDLGHHSRLLFCQWQLVLVNHGAGTVESTAQLDNPTGQHERRGRPVILSGYGCIEGWV